MLISNIQRYCIHDGDGIRTTVFFKGCPLNCRWCHNPENIPFDKTLMFYEERCIGCGKCAAACPTGCLTATGGYPAIDRAKCIYCGACVNACPTEAFEIAGQEMTPRQVLSKCMTDLEFFESSGGGVTLSGGEVMSQSLPELLELVKLLKAEYINVAIDTCGHAPWSAFDAILPYVNVFLYDIKLMDPRRHKEYIGTDNEIILQNLIRLNKSGAAIHLRMPLIDGVNATDEDINEVIDFLKQNGITPVKISLLAYHSIGEAKRLRFDTDYSPPGDFKTPDSARMQDIKKIFEDKGFHNTQIGG